MAASLNYRHVFGVKVNVPNSLHFAEDGTVVFPVGHNVVKHNVETRGQEFLNASESSLAISCVTVSPSKRFIAVAEKRVDGGQVSVFNLRNLFKKKTLSTPEVSSQEFVSLSFSADDSILITLGGAPDWTLACWSWEKGKLMSTIRVSPSPDMTMYHCLLNPVNSTKCCTVGNRILKILSIEDERMLNIPMSASFAEREPADYRSVAWLPEDKFVVGTRAGDILLFKKEELLSVITSATAGALPRGPAVVSSVGYDSPIHTIISCSRGFYTGNDQGIVRLYEPVAGSGGTLYSDTKSHRLPIADITPAVIHMALSPSEELLAVTTSVNSILQINLAQADVKEDVSFTGIGVWSHGPVLGTHVNALSTSKSVSCGITGLDVCVRKPIVATCGYDCTVRLWNYLSKTQELVKSFAEEPHSVAIHPTGLHVVVGFSDKLRFMNVLMDDLRTVKELPVKACKEVRFSNGGSMFAVVASNLVVVGHNGKVSSVSWLYNDTVLVTVGVEGAVYQWSLPDGKRFGEFLNKGIGFTGVVATKEVKRVFATASDCSTKEIDMEGGIVLKEAGVKSQIACLAISSNNAMMFAARNTPDVPGSIISYSMPFDADVFDYPASAGPITRVRISFDDTTLFATGSDGTLFVFEIRDKDGRIPHRDTSVSVPWSDEVLVTRSDLEERSTAISELRDAVEELQSNNDYANRMRDIAFQERLKKLTERYTTELDHNREQFDLLKEEKMDMEHEYSERLKVLELSHQAEMQKRESLYQNKIMEEVDRFQELQLEVESEKDRQKEIHARIIEAHAAEVEATKSKCASEWEEIQYRRKDLEEEVAGVKKDWDEMKRQMEEDIDTEVEQLKKRCEDELTTEREATLKYKGDNGIMKKKFAALSKEIEDQREEIKAMLDKEKELAAHAEALKKEIEMLRGVINDKDDTIADKEKKIYDLKKRNQELEKFKFVLDYKIKELKRQIEPREQEIADMREQIKKVDSELEAYHKSNAELDAMIGTLRGQLDDLQKSMAEKRILLAAQETTMSRFKHDLHAVIQNLLDAEKLAAGMQELKTEYGLDDTSAQGPNEAITREYGRQSEFLRRKVDEAKRQLTSQAEEAANAIKHITEDNLALIDEIKTLRKDIKAAKEQRAAVKSQRSKTKPSPSTTVLVVATGQAISSTARDVTARVQLSITQQRDEIGSLKAEVRRLEGLLASVKM